VLDSTDNNYVSVTSVASMDPKVTYYIKEEDGTFTPKNLTKLDISGLTTAQAKNYYTLATVDVYLY